ncbi:MAG: hypothetical protein NVV74_13365 [Magnetospirillum sp.]|nr:hypothetical protein [Magnetospirillum sp.]
MGGPEHHGRGRADLDPGGGADHRAVGGAVVDQRVGAVADAG